MDVENYANDGLARMRWSGSDDGDFESRTVRCHGENKAKGMRAVLVWRHVAHRPQHRCNMVVGDVRGVHNYGAEKDV